MKTGVSSTIGERLQARWQAVSNSLARRRIARWSTILPKIASYEEDASFSGRERTSTRKLAP